MASQGHQPASPSCFLCFIVNLLHHLSLLFCRFSFRKPQQNRIDLFFFIYIALESINFSFPVYMTSTHLHKSTIRRLFFLLAGKRPVASPFLKKKNRISICQHQSDVSVLISQPRPILLYLIGLI